MLIGTLRVRLAIREARSLKDKRRVVKSIKDRLRQEFNISISETENMNLPQSAVLGIAMVSNESAHLKQALGKVREAISCHPVAELLDSEMEV